MASMKEIRERISSVQQIMKITNAMYLISSSNLKRAKKNLENNNHILSLVLAYQKETSQEKKLSIKKELYLNKDYKLYMDSYNELSLIVLKINKQYQKYTHTKIHACH